MTEQPVPTVPVETLGGVVYATAGEAQELQRQTTKAVLQAVVTMCAELWPWPTLLTVGAAAAGVILVAAAMPDPVQPKSKTKLKARKRQRRFRRR